MDFPRKRSAGSFFLLADNSKEHGKKEIVVVELNLPQMQSNRLVPKQFHSLKTFLFYDPENVDNLVKKNRAIFVQIFFYEFSREKIF